MGTKRRTGADRELTGPKRADAGIGEAVSAAIRSGFVVGREVLVGRVPGIVVGYNIAGVGRFVGHDYPLVVRTALGVAKCGVDEVLLA